MALVELDRMEQVLTEVDFAPLKQRQNLAAGPLADPHLNIRISLRITKQKARQNAFDMLRRARDFQDASISVTQQLRLFLDGTGTIEKNAAPRNHLLAFAGQEQ